MEDAHQVGELARLVAQEARAGEHAGEGFLHQVLGVLGRAAERPRRPLQALPVPRQRLWIQDPHGGHAAMRSSPSIAPVYAPAAADVQRSLT